MNNWSRLFALRLTIGCALIAATVPAADRPVVREKAVYYRGVLGTGKIEVMAKMRRWVAHRIEIEATTIRWFQDGTKMLEGSVPGQKRGGYFGIRHRYERGTRYDDVRITIFQKA